MRIDQLEYFYCTAQHKSMSLASQKLHITPQALSMSIKSLERKLGFDLLTKTPAGITLTPKGKATYHLVEEILDRIELIKNLHENISTNETSLTGSLRIVATPIASITAVKKTFMEFHKTYPNIDLYVEETVALSALENLCTQNFDFAILNYCMEKYQNLPKEITSQLNIKILHSSKVGVAVSTTSPLANKKSLSLKAIAHQPIITASLSNLDDFGVKDELKKYCFLKGSSTYSNIGFVLESIVSNHGLAFTFLDSLDFIDYVLKPSLKVIPLKEDISHEIVVVTNKNQPLSPIAQQYIQQLEKLFNL